MVREGQLEQVIYAAFNHCSEAAVKEQLHSGSGSLRCPYKAVPTLTRNALYEEYLNLPARGFFPKQPGMNHPGVIQHEKIALMQIIKDILKSLVIKSSLCSIDHKKPFFSAINGILCNKPLG